ncbi:hypothetical protein [Mesorhizobium sp. ANAO-SY3R2]|uniref:hypothetical protein n=1 Tax=Mesorhizobium sp. ANAO-SY3R2 TaxID=3166644 RepID=UPI00366B3FDF
MAMQSKHRFFPRAGAALPLGMRRAVAVLCSPLSFSRAALRLLMPALLMFFIAFGQAASAHPAGGQHQSHASQAHANETVPHHGNADIACCGDMGQDEADRACLAQCLAACGYCAPLPLSAALPVKTDSHPSPHKYAVLHGAIAAPHPRPPSIS